MNTSKETLAALRANADSEFATLEGGELYVTVHSSELYDLLDDADELLAIKSTPDDICEKHCPEKDEMKSHTSRLFDLDQQYKSCDWLRGKECTDLDCPVCDNLYNAAKTVSDLGYPSFTCDCYDDGKGGATAWFTLGDWKRRLGNMPTDVPSDTFSLTPAGLGLMMAMHKKTTNAFHTACADINDMLVEIRRVRDLCRGIQEDIRNNDPMYDLESVFIDIEAMLDCTPEKYT